MLKRNEEIMGLFCEVKGIRKRKTKKRGMSIGRKRENSEDTRLEYREVKLFTKRGVRTRRVWLSEEPLPLFVGGRRKAKQRWNPKTRNLGFGVLV